MRNHFCVGSGLHKNKRRIFSWNCLKVLHVFLLTIVLSPFKGMCSKGDMLSENNASSVSSGGRELATDHPTPLPIKKGTESKLRGNKTSTVTVANISLNSHELTELTELNEEHMQETISNPTITESAISNPVDNALIPEPDYESPHYTSSMPETGSYPFLESNELSEAEQQADIGLQPANEMDNLSYEDEITSESTLDERVENQDDLESDIDSAPVTSETKSMLSSSTASTRVKIMGASVPPPLPLRSKYPLLKKVPTRLIAAANNKVKPPKKLAYKVTRSTTKRPLKLTTTKIRRPGTPFPHSRDPNHPHGVIVFDKRKKRPKPGHRRHTTKATTTTTASTTTPTTTTTTTSTTTPIPLEADYYDYDWGVGESGELTENLGSNSTNSSTTTNHKPSIPLSKLAMAMIASSTIFDNGTGSDEDEFYPKTPVNLLHILQSYTKQLQLANAQSTVKQPAVQIQTTPFMLQLSQLNFGTRVAISIYYSLIAIIPLVYLAFGGLGRLGFFNAFGGRGFGRRRRKRSYGGNQYYFGGNDGYQTTIIQRSNLNERNDDEYTWILGRISEIILEFSLMADEIEK